VRFDPKHLIWVGAILLLLGVVLPFLMVVHVIESTYFLNFFAYSCIVIGMVLTTIGTAMVAGINRSKNKWK